MADNVEVWLELDNTQHRALSIPMDTCMQFAISPLAWLSYLGFTICGSEGHIANTPYGEQLEYHPVGVQVHPGIYYYIAGGESFCGILGPHSPLILDPRWLDIEMMDDRASYASGRTSRRADFRQDIINRDGTCVMTGTPPENCQACHIVPHSKGDQVCPNISPNHSKLIPASIL